MVELARLTVTPFERGVRLQADLGVGSGFSTTAMAAPNSPARVVVVDVPCIPSDEVAVPRALADHLKTVVHQGYDVVVLDVGALTHPDSITLGAIVQTYVSAVRGGGTVKLTNVSKRFRDLLTVTKLDRIMEIVDVVVDADRMVVPHEAETSQAKITES
jgi:anti-anti-sigma factor